MPRPDYYHMFNSWFAYSGTGRPGGYQHPAHFKVQTLAKCLRSSKYSHFRQPTGLRRTTPNYLLSLEEAERAAAALGQQDEAQRSPSSQFTPIRQEPPPYHTRIHIELNPPPPPQPATTQPPSASSTQPTSMPLIAFPNTRYGKDTA